LFLIDDSISTSLLSKANKILKKRNFAFPVKLRGDAQQVKERLQSCLETSVLVLQGGHYFELRVAKTESMKTKDATKNVIHALIRAVSLIIYAQAQTKHNRV
jgi:hypothetical protein